MASSKADIIAKLQKDILPLQGYKNMPAGSATIDLGPVNAAFPNHVFPSGAIHQFISYSSEDAAATGGFVAGITAGLMRKSGAALWISAARSIFPPALTAFGIEPDKIIFIDLKTERDVLWAMEEALKCEGLPAAICEMKDLGFTASRRFQLAVEQSGVTGFVLQNNPRELANTACVSRWVIHSLHSGLEEEMPGVGFPRWKVELLKVRNGRPGSWIIEWVEGGFKPVPNDRVHYQEEQRKTG